MDNNYTIAEVMGRPAPKGRGDYENYRTDLTTVIAYLIGVDDKYLTGRPEFNAAKLEEIGKDQNARIIRNLCILRMNFLLNYKKIQDRRYKSALEPLDGMTDLLNRESIDFLRSCNIEPIYISLQNEKNITYNIAFINQYILEKIDTIRPFIMETYKFEYIKNLFMMPDCQAGTNGANLKKNPNEKKKIKDQIHKKRKEFFEQQNNMPFHTYINFPRPLTEKDGNILYNDSKFLKLLYGANHDIFKATEYLVDAKSEDKESIYDFVAGARNIAAFVDCENVDPFCFAAALLNLKAEGIARIRRIFLYNDVHTSPAWDSMEEITSIPVELIETQRTLEHKSNVDMVLALSASREFYQDKVESILLVSSDSDFLPLIQSLQPQGARFYVLNETRKTSIVILEKLEEWGVRHCFMDDFAQDVVQTFKTRTLLAALRKRIRSFNETGTFETLDCDELLDSLYRESFIGGAEEQIAQERQVFFNNYLKKGLVLRPTIRDGRTVLEMDLNT